MKQICTSTSFALLMALGMLQPGCDGDPLLVEPILPAENDTTDAVNIDNLKMNELQAIGSHNSYRIKTYEPILNYLLALPSPPSGLNPEELDYTHEPLPVQLDSFKMRSIELDIYYDPNGGQYYNRQGNTLVLESTASNEPELQNPGMKVLHIIDIDYLTHYLTFVSALNAVKSWSDAHPKHLPLIVMIEAKEDGIPLPFFTDPLPFTGSAFDEVDMEIATVFGSNPGKVVTPDDFRGIHTTVNEAVLAGDWPTLSQCRGSIYFVMMVSSAQKADYLAGHAGLTGRKMFIFGEPGDDETAFIKFDDPVVNQDTIQNLVKKGYMVRTRADAGTLEARSGDYSRMNMAFSSGAQMVSTDYYRPDERALTDPGWSGYSVTFPSNETALLNPVNGPVQYVGMTIYE